MRKTVLWALCLASSSLAMAQGETHSGFSEPRDGGNLDLVRSTFDGSVAYLVPRWHENEALGSGSTSRRWRNMLFALHGVRGKIVTFHLPARPPESGAMVHNMDSATANLLEPVWSYQDQQRTWNAFTVVDCMKPDAADTVGAAFPTDSIVDNSGSVTVKSSSPRRDDYGWVFRNTTPFTEDVVYISVNEHYPVQEYYGWLETKVFPHRWVKPTASEAVPGSFLIGYQSGATAAGGAFEREIPDTALYAFQIQDPAARPTKVMLLVSGQHPYEGQTKAALQGAVEWILDPQDPAAAAYRAEYITLVYPFVNPTGELAGLWRGTAADPRRDTNRNWNTPLTDPLADRGIDTVIIHKQAMQRDVTALGLGQPYAVVDLHQNFGDQLPALHYVLHNTNPLASAWVQRLQERVEIAGIISNPATNQTLRSYWLAAGASMSLCIERSTYSTLAAENEFGRELMRAFAPVVPEAPLAPAPVRTVELTAETPLPLAAAATIIQDSFGGAGALEARIPDGGTLGGARWTVELGEMTAIGGAAVAGDMSTRATIETGGIDRTVEAEIQLTGENAISGLVFRGVDRENYYFFRLQTSGWVFGRVVQNTATMLASGRKTYPFGVPHRLRAETKGNAAVLMVNEAVVHVDTVPAEPGATRAGLGSGSAYSFNAYNFRVWATPVAGDGTEGGGGASRPAETAEAGFLTGPWRFLDRFSGSGQLAERRSDKAPIGSPTWQVSLGSFELRDGRLFAGPTASRAFLDAGVLDARVTADIVLPEDGSSAGLSFRGADRDNFHYFRLQTGGWIFGRIIANTAYPIATGTRPYPTGVAFKLEAECAGNHVTLRINGQTVHRGVIDADVRAATRFGLSSGTPVPFVALSFGIDAGATMSLGGEGDGEAVQLPEQPRPSRVQRMLGPAGRFVRPVSRTHHFSALVPAPAD